MDIRKIADKELDPDAKSLEARKKARAPWRVTLSRILHQSPTSRFSLSIRHIC
jgi:hypothetical protein